MTNHVTADWLSDPAPRRCRCRDDEIAAVGRRAVLLMTSLATAGVQQVLMRGRMRGQLMTTTEVSSVVEIKAVKWRVLKYGTVGRRRWVVDCTRLRMGVRLCPSTQVASNRDLMCQALFPYVASADAVWRFAHRLC